MAWIAGALSDRIIISHAELVHQAKASAVQIEHALAHFDPDVVGKKPLRIHQRVVDREVLLEPDLAFHGVLPPLKLETLFCKRAA